MRRFIALALLAGGLSASSTAAQEPGWWGVVIAPQSIRPQIESTPIIHRPYRPFHFYGNTIRRRHYRGTALPAPRDFVRGGGALIRGQ
ncbi:MAG TPA: hypothetical protein VMM76_17445 [Pirellulaceae bacterium]|nr:hypothetical protein [Pirellulaceae bacterium]